MIAKIAMVFVGFLLVGALLNLYFAVLTFLTVFLLGLDNELLLTVQYWLCFAAGVVTSFYLMRKVWPKTPQRNVVTDEQLP